MKRTSASEWFMGLSREQRKEILAVMHDARSLLQQQSHRLLRIYEGVLSRLEDDHEEAKGKTPSW